MSNKGSFKDSFPLQFYERCQTLLPATDWQKITILEGIKAGHLLQGCALILLPMMNLGHILRKGCFGVWGPKFLNFMPTECLINGP